MKKYQYLIIGVVLIFSSQAFAYRGQGYSEQTLPPQKFTSFSPGYFDTNLAPKGRLLGELPTFAMDYGLTENLTIGTSALPMLATSFGKPVVYLKMRYRFFSNRRVSSAITGYGSGFWFSDSMDMPNTSNALSTRGGFLGLTSNTSIYLKNNHVLTFHLTAFRFRISEVDLQRDLTTDFNIYALAPGVGYQYFPLSWLGLEANLLFPLAFHTFTDSPVSLIKNDLLSGMSDPIPYRVMLTLMTGSKSMLSIGALGVIADVTPLAFLPFLTWSILF